MEQLLSGTHAQEFQQLQQELLQQQSQDQNQQLDQQLNFALQETQFQTAQPMDLLMSGVDQTQQTSNMQSRNDDNNSGSINVCQNAMSNQMEMDQMLDIDFMQVLKCFESAPAGENLGDLAGGLSLFNDMDVMNIGECFGGCFFGRFFKLFLDQISWIFIAGMWIFIQFLPFLFDCNDFNRIQ